MQNKTFKSKKMKFREDELKERAIKILNVGSNVTADQIRKAYRKKARQVHPDISNQEDMIMGIVNQAYSLLIGENAPTSLLENDSLVSLVIGLPVDPIEQFKTYEQWMYSQFYSGGIPYA